MNREKRIMNIKLYLLPVVACAVIGCSKYDHTVENRAIQSGADSPGFRLDALGGMTQALGGEWIYLFEGTYYDREFNEKLPIPEFECPGMVKLGIRSGEVSYTLKPSAEERFSKSESDRCILHFASILMDRIGPRLESIASYQ